MCVCESFVCVQTLCVTHPMCISVRNQSDKVVGIDTPPTSILQNNNETTYMHQIYHQQLQYTPHQLNHVCCVVSYTCCGLKLI